MEMNSRHKRKPKKLGALIVEYFDADVHETQIDDDLKLIVKQSEIALENTRKHGEIFMLPIWKRLGWLQKLLFRDHFAKTMTGLAALTLFMLAMFFWPKEHKMKVEGVLHPTVRQTIFSRTDGIVKEILIGERARVKADQPLLELENRDLALQIVAVEFEIKAIDDRINNANSMLSSSFIEPKERDDIGMQLVQLRNEKKALEAQLDLWKLKEGYQTVVSPIEGTIITSQLERRFNQLPVEPNYPLLEVAQLDGSWQLELKIPQTNVVYVEEAFAKSENKPLDVEFKIGTNPNLNLKGTLVRDKVEGRLFQSETTGEPVLRAIVEIPDEQLEELQNELRSGAGATAKILCGKKPLGYVWFHQIYDWFRIKIFF